MADSRATKGYDDSPPRNAVITFYTVLAVVVLFGVAQLLKSYFAKMMDAEYTEKVYTVGLEATQEYKAREQEQLEKSGITTAMKAFAQRGRAASPVLVAESGAGKAAIAGWSQLKREVSAVAAAPEVVPVEGAKANPDLATSSQTAPSMSGDVRPSQGPAARIVPEGQPVPVHDDPENSRTPATDTGAKSGKPAENTPRARQNVNENAKPAADAPAKAAPAEQK